MKIDEKIDEDYETVRITDIGLIDPLTGAIVFKSDSGQEFHITAFSAETAHFISNFLQGLPETSPSVYKMIEQICEESELLLVKVKIYESGGIFRANLYFTGKKDIVLRNFRASDAIALATFYKIPILVRKNILKESKFENSKP